MSNHAWQYTKRRRLSGTIEKVSRPIPTPKEGEIVVDVKAAALNLVEEQVAQSSDMLLKFVGAPPVGTPFVPSADFAGVVRHVGPGVDKWKIGDEVFGVTSCMEGGSASGGVNVRQQNDAAAHDYSRKRSDGDEAFGSLIHRGRRDPSRLLHGLYGFCDVWKAAVQPARPRRRNPLGSGPWGIERDRLGRHIQMAKKMGLKVVATCSGASRDMVSKLDANEIIDYRTEHVAEMALMSPHAPYAVVFDCVGGKDLLPSLEHLILNDPKAPQLGIYINIVGDKTGRDAMGGAITNVSSVVTWLLQYYYPAQALRTLQGSLTDILPAWTPLKSWIAGRRYACIMMQPTPEMLETGPEFVKDVGKVMIDSVHAFDDAKKAFEKLESGRAKGKVVGTM